MKIVGIFLRKLIEKLLIVFGLYEISRGDHKM